MLCHVGVKGWSFVNQMIDLVFFELQLGVFLFKIQYQVKQAQHLNQHQYYETSHRKNEIFAKPNSGMVVH